MVKQYLNNITNYILSHNKKPIFWEGAFTYESKFPLNVTLQAWKIWPSSNPIGYESIKTAIKDGRDAIQSTFYYLDWNSKWSELLKYNVNPTDYNNNHLLGGECTLWAEKIDYTNIEERLWPRGCVTAEKFYSIKESVYNFKF